MVIEASFVAIERSIQFYLPHRGHGSGEELRHEHAAVYRRGAKMNLFSESFADRLTRLWKHNRTEVYYRGAVASAEQVETMLSLAGSVHQHVLEFAASRHECVCSR